MLTAGTPWMQAGALQMQSAAELLRLEKDAKVLVLTDWRGAGRWSRERGAVVHADAASLAGPEGEFDGAVVDGLLEREHWDRWLLQAIHRRLRPGAPVVVVVPPLLSVFSALDSKFLTYTLRVALMPHLARWAPEWAVPGRVRRRYKLARLRSKLEAAGFTAIVPGPGWPGEQGAHLPFWLARRALVRARKESNLPGFGGRAWPDLELHRRRFANEHATLIRARDAWLAAHPGFLPRAPRALDPAEWRDARVLVLSPHPDDELIGCGGTLCRVLAAGAKVTILQATDGSRLESLRELPPARRKTIRLDEAHAIAATLGAELILWREEDARLQPSEAAIERLAKLLAALKPTHVFTPFLADLHADHRVLSDMLSQALGRTSVNPLVLQYEVWSLVPANLYCDITAHAQLLERLLLFYECAIRVEDFLAFCASRNLARAAEFTGRAGYAEAFLCGSGDEYRQWAQRQAH